MRDRVGAVLAAGAAGSAQDGAVAPGGRFDPSPAALLLCWYDHHHRRLPWRAELGQPADPYRVWISEIMLQQTSARAVIGYYERFVQRFPSLQRLAAAPLEEVLAEWAGLGYYARARNLHACAGAIMAQHSGRFPGDPTTLQALPGIGPYTAAAIAAIAFDWPQVPLDGNIARVVARLFAVGEPLASARPRLAALANTLGPRRRAGDFAQALMDLGALICRPRQPACRECPLASCCAALRSGEAERFPVRPPRRKTSWRHGAAFVVVRSGGSVLVRARPLKGLLGGMTELPTTAFSAAPMADDLPQAVPALLRHGRRFQPQFKRLPGAITHAFTHFHLKLVVYAAAVPGSTTAPAGLHWLAFSELAQAALPSLMRKVLNFSLPQLQARRAR